MAVNFVSFLLEKNHDPGKVFVSGDHGTLTYAEFEQKL